MDQISNTGGSKPTAESRVLIIMTGGTICMKQSDDGLIPSRGFLKSGMAPRPSFNDGSNPADVDLVLDDGTQTSSRSLRTPMSRYRKHIRYAVFEFEKLLDSSSINGMYLWGYHFFTMSDTVLGYSSKASMNISSRSPCQTPYGQS